MTVNVEYRSALKPLVGRHTGSSVVPVSIYKLGR